MTTIALWTSRGISRRNATLPARHAVRLTLRTYGDQLWDLRPATVRCRTIGRGLSRQTARNGFGTSSTDRLATVGLVRARVDFAGCATRTHARLAEGTWET